MPILIDRKTHIVIHGVEGEAVSLVQQLLAYGTNVAAFVEAGKGGSSLLDLPFFDTVARAKKQSDANVSLIFSSKDKAADAILEAEDAAIPLIICNASSIPLQDMAEVQRIIRRNKKSQLIGPGSYGIITPGQSKVGCMPGYMYTPGTVGIVSRFGTLMDEVAWGLTSSGIGQSTCIHVGDYPFLGASINDLVSLLEHDDCTDAIIVIGERKDFTSLQNVRKEIVGISVDGTEIEGLKIPIYDNIELFFKEFIKTT
jgi:succinyl-CoA synthetase alpha subunit